MIIMKTIDIRGWKKKLANQMSQDDCKQAKLKQPPTIKMYKGRGGRENSIPNKPATKSYTNHTVRYQNPNT